MKWKELIYNKMEDTVTREYKEGKISYEEMFEKLIEIEKRKEFRELLDKLVIIVR